VGVKANHGGIKSESVEESESAAADSELSMTPARQRRQAADAQEDGQIDSEEQLAQQQHDVTVCFCFSLAH